MPRPERTMFQLQHYEIFADLLSRVRRQNLVHIPDWEQAKNALDCVEANMIVLFAADNPRFDPKRFKEACR